MKYRVTAAIAVVLAATQAGAQVAPPPQPTPPPVQETQAPENEVINPEQKPVQPLPPAAARAPATEPDKPAKWNVNAPTGLTTRQVPINVDEGTWMNVDVSPDGRTIAFDLLGDIYTMPIAGGTPTRIAEGLAYEQQPRFSPDGRRIAFTSDRGGGDNIWIMNADGSDKRQLTKEDFRLLNQPSWSPDGRFIAAKKHFTTGRSLGTGEVWLYHVSGGGGVPLVKKPNEQHQKELGEPIYAPDGKAIYFTRNITPGPDLRICPGFEHQSVRDRALRARDRRGHDGRSPAPAARCGRRRRRTARRSPSSAASAAKSKLYVKDLVSGEERKIYDALDQDVQETWAVTGVYPNMDWTPDSRSRSSSGPAASSAGSTPTAADAREIPFRVNDTRVVDRRHAPAGRGRARPLPDQDAALGERLARRPPDRLRDARQVVGQARRRRRGPPAGQGRRGRARALPVLVARRPERSSTSAGPTRASAGSAPSRRPAARPAT